MKSRPEDLGVDRVSVHGVQVKGGGVRGRTARVGTVSPILSQSKLLL